MHFEEPINRKVMRQYLIGPLFLATLLICTITGSLLVEPKGDWLALRLTLLGLVGGFFVGGVILSLRRVFRELLQAKDYFSGVFGSMRSMVVVTDSSGNIQMVNKATVERLGESERDLYGRKIQDLLQPDSSPFKGLDLTGRAGTREFLRDVESVMVTGDGEQVPVLLSSSLLRDPQGRPAGMVCVAQDVTERKKAEAESRKMQAQLIQASKLASLGTIGSGVAHELNNPLTIVKAAGEVILENAEDVETVKESVAQIIHSAERMKKITDHLRTFARESKKDDWEQLDVNRPIRDSLVLLEQKFRTEDIRLELNLTSSLPVIWGDANQLESVFQNLLTNSRDAFDEVTDGRQKSIFIETSQGSDGGVLFRYRDNAMGMPPEVLERIFDPFFTTKGAGKGTGLGMSILHGIVQKHRGKLEVESEAGKGTMFKISLPPDRRAARRAAPTPEKASSGEPTATVQGPLPTLLIVDDEIKIAHLLKMMLRKVFRAEVAEDAADGMKRIESNTYDLVITDLQMPKFSGIEIIDAIKKKSPHTPVVLMSGNGDGDAKVQKALARGAIGILDKPFKDPKSVQKFLKDCMTEKKAA